MHDDRPMGKTSIVRPLHDGFYPRRSSFIVQPALHDGCTMKNGSIVQAETLYFRAFCPSASTKTEQHSTVLFAQKSARLNSYRASKT
jgi:hypothetical protein